MTKISGPEIARRLEAVYTGGDVTLLASDIAGAYNPKVGRTLEMVGLLSVGTNTRGHFIRVKAASFHDLLSRIAKRRGQYFEVVFTIPSKVDGSLSSQPLPANVEVKLHPDVDDVGLLKPADTNTLAEQLREAGGDMRYPRTVGCSTWVCVSLGTRPADVMTVLRQSADVRNIARPARISFR